MSLSENTKIDKIEIVESGVVIVREVTTIEKDGVVMAQNFHRTSFVPGQDISNQSDQIKSLCETVWTPEVIANYTRILEEHSSRLGTPNTPQENNEAQ